MNQRFAVSPYDQRIHIADSNVELKLPDSFWALCGKSMPTWYELLPSLKTAAAMCQQCVRTQNDAFVPKEKK